MSIRFFSSAAQAVAKQSNDIQMTAGTAVKVSELTLSKYLWTVIKGAGKSIPVAWKKVYAKSDALFKEGKTPSWDDEKARRQSIRDVRLTALWTVPSIVGAFYIHGMALIPLVSSPFIWFLTGFNSSITPSYGIPSPSSIAFYPEMKSNIKACDKVISSIESNMRREGNEKFKRALQNWNLFRRTASNWIDADVKKFRYPRGKNVPNIPENSKSQLIQDVRMIFRMVENLGQNFTTLSVSRMDAATIKSSLKVMNKLHPIPIGPRYIKPTRAMAVYRLLKPVISAIEDDAYIYDRNAAIDMTDVYEILNRRAGIPYSVISQLPEEALTSLVNSYVHFSLSLRKDKDFNDSESIPDLATSFIFMKSLISKRCAYELDMVNK